MNQEQRSLLAAVAAIRAGLAGPTRRDADADKLPVEAWDDLVQITRRVERARRHGWHLAAAELAGDQVFEAESLRNYIAYWLERRRERPAPRPLPNGGNLYHDLAALKREFGEFKLAGDTLTVTTEPIALEGIELGRFEIRLNCAEIGSHDGYRVVALDPNPAGKNDAVTHPHVLDERLCPGNGRSAIEQALRDWRLYDFFVVVNQILLTYSRGSAHVELADWDGESCSGCGCSTDDGDSYHCQGCSCTLCCDCTYSCHGCGYEFCSNCSANCEHCDESYCAPCLWTCPKCKAAVCSDCRETENNTLCKKCHERETADAEQGATVTRRPGPTRRARAAV